MSHELRTPLHVILGFGHLLHRKTKPNGEHEYLTQILTAGDHLLALINQVLELSYLRSNNLISSTEPTRSREPAVKEPMPSSTATGQ
jgi:signal transduction histidine kinase